jgi:antitoxin component of RelBE/YafQ-DinJ toxin-antitoxin module
MRTETIVIRLSEKLKREITTVAESLEMPASTYVRNVVREALDRRNPVDRPQTQTKRTSNPARQRMDEIAGMTYETLMDADLDTCKELVREFKELRAECKVADPMPDALKQRYNELVTPR